MTQKTISILFLVGALTACGGGDPAAPECASDTSCVGAEPDSAVASSKDRDAGAAPPAVRNDGGAAPLPGASVQDRPADAGMPAKDAGPPSSTADSSVSAPPSGETKPSVGCGVAAPMAGNGSIDVMGTAREYILTLPKSYDPAKPYKLVFAWHGLGGTAAQIARSFYGLQAQSNDSTIFVAGQGLQTSNSVGSGPGWPNTGGQDVAFVKALYARLQGQLCIDENRVFSVGMSYGGIMSNTLGCQMGDVFRAIAPMSGSGPGYGGRASSCVGEVAVWMSHGDNDTVVSTASGQASRDYWSKTNHCQMQTSPVDPSPCVAYAGCDPASPVTWCEFVGGHTVPPFAAKAIWAFFSQF